MIKNRIFGYLPNETQATSPLRKPSPLVRAAMEANLTFEDDIVRVALWNAWEEMFADLCKVGTALAITGNEAAVLGVFKEYPAAEFGHQHQLPALLVDASQMWSASATHRGEEDGNNRFAVEFEDLAGHTVHKVCLGPESNFCAYLHWVNQHQAAGPNLHHFQPDSELWPTRSGRSWLGKKEFASGALERILRACLAGKLPVHVQVCNCAVRHCASFQPISLAWSDEWMFVSDSCHGLHLKPGEMQCELRVDERSGYRIQCQQHGDLVAEFSAGSNESIREWNRLLATAISEI